MNEFEGLIFIDEDNRKNKNKLHKKLRRGIGVKGGERARDLINKGKRAENEKM